VNGKENLTMEKKRTRGRPTKYRSEFCELVLELGAKGKSKAQMAAALGCDRASIDRWADDHEEFCNAMAMARDLALAWWEDVGQEGMWQSSDGLRLNPQLWSRSMSARFPDDYRENRGVELTGRNGGAVAVVDETAKAARVAQLLALAQGRKDGTDEHGPE
jgi:hypothetical protein